MTEQILIDAGRSLRGWSRIGQYLKCPQLFAYTNRIGLSLIPTGALQRGSLGHVIQAHQHAIWGCQQGGVWVDDVWHEDASVFLSPEEAGATWCSQNREREQYLEPMIQVFRRYMAKHPEPPGRILAVEYPITAVLGRSRGTWGLWVVDPTEVPRCTRSTTQTLRGFHGNVITPTPLNSPGHLDHGKPIMMTRRLDMAIQDRAKRVWIWDHKHQAMVQPNKSVGAYAIDGGFAAFRIMGKQVWPDEFAGLTLNLIQTRDPWRVARPTVPPTPHRDGHFAEILWRAEHGLAQLDMETTHWKWPKAMHETTCYGRYGACPATKLCSFGESAVEDEMLNHEI